MYMDKVPLRDELEFTKMRYTAITCDPNDFVVRVTLSARLKLIIRTTGTHSGRNCTIHPGRLNFSL
jgi:hypothetical protein